MANVPQLNHQIAVTAGVLADECGQLLRGFFESRR
jgi:tRNA(adenine34) deaminase